MYTFHLSKAIALSLSLSLFLFLLVRDVSDLTCDGIDAPYALGRPFFTDQCKRLGFGSVAQVRAAAKLDGVGQKLWVLRVWRWWWCDSQTTHEQKHIHTHTIHPPCPTTKERERPNKQASTLAGEKRQFKTERKDKKKTRLLAPFNRSSTDAPMDTTRTGSG